MAANGSSEAHTLMRHTGITLLIASIAWIATIAAGYIIALNVVVYPPS